MTAVGEFVFRAYGDAAGTGLQVVALIARRFRRGLPGQTDRRPARASPLKGAYSVARRLVPHMMRQSYGKLVFMASTNSWDAEAGLVPYNVSKAGVYLLAKTLAREFEPHGINSNAVAPGFIRTRLTEPFLQDPAFMTKYTPASNIIPLGRLGLPEDVAGPALFLASRDADYVTGTLLFVDGGQLA